MYHLSHTYSTLSVSLHFPSYLHCVRDNVWFFIRIDALSPLPTVIGLSFLVNSLLRLACYGGIPLLLGLLALRKKNRKHLLAGGLLGLLDGEHEVVRPKRDHPAALH